MAPLSVEVSRPYSSIAYHPLEPHEYLQSPPVARTVKRKSGMSVTAPVRKKSRFDIAPASQDDNINSF